MKERGLVKTPYDELTYKVNGLAMQTHDELKGGHAEKFYQRRLAELCRDAGLAVEIEKRVEVWVKNQMLGYLQLDLWIEETLVAECKSILYPLGKDEIGQVLTYLAATGSLVGLLYNFGRQSLEFKRILPPLEVQDWQKYLYRYVHLKKGMKPPPLDRSAGSMVPPIRFNVISKKTTVVEIPSPSRAAVRLSVQRSATQSASPRPSDYAASGVSIDAGNRAVELMKDAVKSTYGPEVLAGIGSFGGLFDASALKEMRDPVLVASTDGVGTKVKLAAQAGSYRSIGHDIVNHCIDDILVQGARPLFFLDYFATSKLDPQVVAEVVTGAAEACREAGMALIGGETAEMPGVYLAGEFDLAGTIVGVLEREDMLPRPGVQPGDVLLGIRSSGPHTNGYSLIRKIFANVPLKTIFPELGTSLAAALLAPHRSYYPVLYPLLPAIKAMAHLTGGGFIENIPRVLPENVDAVVHCSSWPVPPLFALIQQRGEIAPEEMYRVFNMGIGMVAIVDKKNVEKLQKAIPEQTFVIGELVAGNRKVRFE
jgi:phosphoribosylformylglycinamidine cyclo-ligase